jgi:hypothetical protein
MSLGMAVLILWQGILLYHPEK